MKWLVEMWVSMCLIRTYSLYNMSSATERFEKFNLLTTYVLIDITIV